LRSFEREHTRRASGYGKLLARLGTPMASKSQCCPTADVGLRAIQRGVEPQAEHILNWFHLAMRFQHVSQAANGLTDDKVQPFVKQWLRAKIDRAKWNCWNGKAVKGLRYLKDVDEWLTCSRQHDIPGLARLATGLAVLTQYLNANWDSLPNYGKRYRADRPISTAPAESAVNEVIAKRW